MAYLKINKSTIVLLAAVAGIGIGLTAWKHANTQKANAAVDNQPEPVETVTVAVAKAYEHKEKTTSIGTIIARRSITLCNELPGTVRRVMLTPGKVVQAGSVLVRLDVSVEEAELKAQVAQVALARTTLNRMQRAFRNRAASEIEVDRAAAELDVALAQSERLKAIIDRKTIRAPFRARVGLADVHPGQYLKEGTPLTTLQGVDDAVNVDFTVAQRVAAGLSVGDQVDVFIGTYGAPTPATIVACDARIDPATRNATVRARLDRAAKSIPPGSSVRLQVPVGPPRKAVTVPANALRRAPEGDYVFVIKPEGDGGTRAHRRQVKSGDMLGDEVVLYDGISAGEKIAASGSFKLSENNLVAVANHHGSAKESR